MFMLEIAGGVILGGIALYFLGALFSNFFEWLEDQRGWRERSRAFRNAYRYAVERGFRADEDSVVPLEERLEEWYRINGRSAAG